MDAANSEVDYKTKRMIYHDIVISQGTHACRPTRRRPPG